MPSKGKKRNRSSTSSTSSGTSPQVDLKKLKQILDISESSESDTEGQNQGQDDLSSRPTEIDPNMDALEAKMTQMFEAMKKVLLTEVKKAIQDSINPLEVRVKSLEDENKRLHCELSEVKAHTVENEQYSRKCSVRIHGIKETPQEDCRSTVVQLCNDKLKVALTTDDIEVAHRLYSRPTRTQDQAPRTMIVVFKSRDMKTTIMKSRRALKGSRTVITDDLTKDMYQVYNRLRNDERVKDCWSWDCKIFAKDHNNRVFRVRYGQPLDSLLQTP